MQKSSDFINFILPDLGAGGAEKVCVVYADFLKAKGYRVRFLVVDGRGIYREYVKRNFELIDFGKTRFRAAICPMVRYINSLSNESNFYLANLWPLTALSFWILFFQKKSKALVCVEHCELSLQYNFAFLQRFIVRFELMVRSFLKCKLMTVSRGVADDMSFLGWLRSNPIIVIYNPVCFKKRVEISGDVSYSGDFFCRDSLKILAIGTLKDQKNFDFLIQVIYEIKKFEKVQAIILGEGPERAFLENRVKRLHLENEVHLLGWASQIEEFLVAADVFVLTSKYEGFANVVAESLVCGTPVIATDCRSGPAEILDNGRYGNLIDLGDLEAFMTTLIDRSFEEFDSEMLKERGKFFSVERSGPLLELLLISSENN